MLAGPGYPYRSLEAHLGSDEIDERQRWERAGVPQLALLGRYGILRAPTFPWPRAHSEIGQQATERVLLPPKERGALEEAVVDLASAAVAAFAYVVPGADTVPLRGRPLLPASGGEHPFEATAA